jgi:hypothetical protein
LGPNPSIPNVLHQATTSLLAQGKKESKSNMFWKLNSDCITVPSCNGHHDFIRIPTGTFYHFLESLSSLLSNGSRFMAILSYVSAVIILMPRSFLSTVLYHPVLAQWSMYQVESILGTRPRVGERPHHPFGRLLIYLYASRALQTDGVLF